MAHFQIMGFDSSGTNKKGGDGEVSDDDDSSDDLDLRLMDYEAGGGLRGRGGVGGREVKLWRPQPLAAPTAGGGGQPHQGLTANNAGLNVNAMALLRQYTGMFGQHAQHWVKPGEKSIEVGHFVGETI